MVRSLLYYEMLDFESKLLQIETGPHTESGSIVHTPCDGGLEAFFRRFI